MAWTPSWWQSSQPSWWGQSPEHWQSGWQESGSQQQAEWQPLSEAESRRRRWAEVGQPAETSSGLKAARRQKLEPPAWSEHLVLAWPGGINTTIPQKGQAWDKAALEEFAADHGCEISFRLRGTRHKDSLQRYVDATGDNPGQFRGRRGYRLTVLGSRADATQVALKCIEVAEQMMGADMTEARANPRFSASRAPHQQPADPAGESSSDEEEEEEEVDEPMQQQPQGSTSSSSAAAAAGPQFGSGSDAEPAPPPGLSSTAAEEELKLRLDLDVLQAAANWAMAQEAAQDAHVAAAVATAAGAPDQAAVEAFTAACVSSLAALRARPGQTALDLADQLQSLLALLQKDVGVEGLASANAASESLIMVLASHCLGREGQVKLALPLQCLASLPRQGVRSNEWGLEL